MIRGQREAFVAGKQAAIAHRFHGAPPPADPYGPQAHKRRAAFQWGVERATRLIDQLEGHSL